MTLEETGPPSVAVTELPPLQDDRLYDADEVSPYVKKSPRWLQTEARAGRIPGGKAGRTPVWSAQQVRDLIAQITSEALVKRPSRGGGPRRIKQRPAA